MTWFFYFYFNRFSTMKRVKKSFYTSLKPMKGIKQLKLQKTVLNSENLFSVLMCNQLLFENACNYVSCSKNLFVCLD